MGVLMFVILYLYACIGVELITKNKVLKDHPEHGEAFPLPATRKPTELC